MECGILSVDCLKKFPAHYVECVFSPADMMKLFEKLLIVSEVNAGEYLMQCVLQAEPLANCNPEPETQSVPPMFLHFPRGAARYGVLCGAICNLMTECKCMEAVQECREHRAISPHQKQHPFVGS